MVFELRHTDKSGLQQFDVGHVIYNKTDAKNYVEYMHAKYGEVPFILEINEELVMERRDFNKPLMIYHQL